MTLALAEFRLLVDHSPVMIWRAGLDALCNYFNETWLSFTGRTPEQEMGNGWAEGVHPEDLDRCVAYYLEHFRLRTAFEMEYRLRRHDGTYRWIFDRGVPFKDDAGDFAGFIGSCVDIEDRRRAQAAEQQKWQQIVDGALDTAIISLNVTGHVTGWNAGATRILGWSEAEMVGQTLDRLFPAGSQQPAREIADAISRGRGGGEEGWRLRKDGSQLWAVGEVGPIRENAEIVGFVKILRDRTQQRAAENALREERRALELLNRAGSALAIERDLHKLVQIVTDAGVELTGAQFGAFFYNVEKDNGESYMLYTLSGAPMEAFSKFPMPRNTAVFAPTFSGEGIVRSDDITQDPRYGKNTPRKGMPEGHLPVRSYLAVPVISRDEKVLGGLFFGHAATGVFSAQSERGLTGLAAQAAVAIDNADLARKAQKEIAERARAQEALHDLNTNLEREVSERTAQLRLNEEALRQAQKMEAVGQLTGGVAHDFNNLLQVITGNMEIVRRLIPNDGRIQRATEQAINGARQAAALTQRLLAFSRRQPLDPKPVDVNALIGGMSELLNRALGETIAVETVRAAGLWKVEADPNALESAILNLAVNARDAMPDGGRLTIETSNTHIDDGYAVAHAEVVPGQYVAIAVSDTGCGMDSNTVQRAFEPFFTTKPVGQGTGLGLSQVYGFVKQSGGHVKIYSEINQGTTVKIYLQRLQRVGAEPDAPSSAAVPRGASEVILVVEDNDYVRSYTVEVLRELGYQVIEAHDGPSAIGLLEAPGDNRIDLLFTDVVLPAGMTGAQVAARARELHPQLKVLFTTGYARNAIFHHGRLDKGVQLITKPFSFDGLAAKVRDVLDGVSRS
jgi:PAS domain S-box-containing protein